MDDFYEQDVVNVSHNDLDGCSAAAVVKKKFPRARIFHCNYGRDVPNNAFVKGSRMYITDFSLSEMEFQKAVNILGASNVYWLDHHKANYEKLEQKGISFAGIRRDDACGAMLTFKFLFPGVDVPEAIKLVDDYDRWVFADPRTKDFAAGISIFETRPGYKSCYIWNDLLSDDKAIAAKRLAVVCDIGKKIRAYTTEKNRILCQDLVYRTEWQGHRFLIANNKHANSMFFDSVDQSDVDVLSILQYSPDVRKYRCSVYSPDNKKPVIQIAQMFPGGGGHTCAAGFQSLEYPYPKPVLSENPPDTEFIIENYRRILEMRKSVIVNQSACHSDKISLMSTSFKTNFCGSSCLAINHPYVTELIRNFPVSCDLIDASDGAFYKTLIGFVLTNSGWYRVGCYFVDQETAPEFATFKQSVNQKIPDARNFYEEDLATLGKVYWFYSKECPVILPKGLV